MILDKEVYVIQIKIRNKRSLKKVRENVRTLTKIVKMKPMDFLRKIKFIKNRKIPASVTIRNKI